MKKKSMLSVLIILHLFCYSQIIYAQSFQESSILLRSDQTGPNQFGVNVAINGNYAVMGSSIEDGAVTSSGVAYVYKFENEEWVQHQTLEASDAAGADQFGGSVAIYNEVIIVGAPAEDENADGEETVFGAGAVYVFELENDIWVEQQKLVPSDRGFFDRFGTNIAIYEDFIAVGVPDNGLDENGENNIFGAGAAFIFERGQDSWEEQQKIVLANRAIGDNFGNSIAIQNNRLVVGAFNEDEDVENENTLAGAGSLHIFELQAEIWEFQQKIVPSDRASNDRFGDEVALDGDFIAVSTPYKNSLTGSAYVFQYVSETWVEQQILLSTDISATDRFGSSIAISGDNIVVGATLEDDDAIGQNVVTSAGSAYIFTRDGNSWSETQKIVASNRYELGFFGTSVDIDNENILIGSPGHVQEDVSEIAVGAGLIFTHVCSPQIEVDTMQDVCSGNSITLIASVPSGELNWYASENASTSILTGSEYATPVLTETTSYWVEVSEGECVSERVEVIVEVNPIPVLSVTDPNPICEGSSATLVATTDLGEVNWFLTEGASEPEFTGEEFTTLELTETTSFWVSGIDNDCGSERVEVVVEVTAVPTLDINEVIPVCSGMQAVISASSENGTINWFISQGATSPEFTGDEFTTSELNENTSFWVEAQNGDCTSERIEVAIPIIPLPEAPSAPSTQEIEIEGSTLADLEVSASGELVWYADEELTVEVLESTLLEDGATYYVVQIVDDCESEATAITVDVTVGLESAFSDGLKWYPNPVSDVIHLESENQGIEKIEVYSMDGKLIVSHPIDHVGFDVDLNLTELRSGIYILYVQSNKAMKSFKMVKK